MARQRKTWKQAETKTASPPPQIPAVDRTEGPDSPAYYPDPPMDKYKDGDTSAWAEDPHKPMSPETAPPAMPGNFTTEKPDHPGMSEFEKHPETPEQSEAKGGGGGKQASGEMDMEQMRQWAEKHANVCVRIASALMPNAPYAEVEERAVKLMDLTPDQLKATMATLNIMAGEEEEEEEEEEVEIEAGKKANVEITARLDKLEAGLGKLVNAMNHFFGMEGDEEGMSDRELMAYLMAEDMDGDGVDQNAPDYGYSDKKSEDQDEFERGEESEGTKEFDEEQGDKMAAEEEAMLRAMLEEMDQEISMTAGKKAEDEEEEEEEKEAGKKASEVEDNQEGLAKGPTIQSGEGGNVNPDEYAPTPVVAQSDGSEKVGDPTPHGKKAGDDTGMAENDIEITAGVDPMGLMAEDTSKEASADDELMQLYADLDLPKVAGQDEESDKDEDIGGGDTLKDMEETEEKAEEEGEEEAPPKEAGKKKKADDEVQLKPQQKAASTGAQKLGNVAPQTKTAATEINELQKLWESAPDVSEVFGVPRSV